MTRPQKKVVTQAEHLFGATCAILIVLGRILPISQKISAHSGGQVGHFRGAHREGRIE